MRDAVAAAHGLVGADPVEVLAWAATLSVPRPGRGATADRWELLSEVAAVDLTVARVLEPHLDAVAILAEADVSAPERSTWGVWAAEQPGARLAAHGSDDGGWFLEGRKPWCSLAGSVSHAVVTAWTGEHTRRAFAVAMDAPGVVVEDGTWVPSGLARVVTGPVHFAHVAARPVGGDGWYLERDGFWWGGIGVAAVWYGGALGLARRLARWGEGRREDPLALLHLGEVDAALTAARSTLQAAAEQVDGGAATGAAAVLLGARTRHVVATQVELVSQRVSRALGPGPLTQEAEHVARVADLAVYVRQHHGERDAAALGGLLPEQPW